MILLRRSGKTCCVSSVIKHFEIADAVYALIDGFPEDGQNLYYKLGGEGSLRMLDRKPEYREMVRHGSAARRGDLPYMVDVVDLPAADEAFRARVLERYEVVYEPGEAEGNG